MPGFRKDQVSEYTRAVSMPGFWIYHCSEYARVVIMPGFWIYLGFEYARVLNMWDAEFTWILNISEFLIYQGTEYARVLNIPGVWIYQGSEYAGVIQAFECAWISLDNSWTCLIVSEYPRMLNSNLSYCDRSCEDCNLPYLKIVQKNICIILVKCSIEDVWQGCEHAWDPEYRVLNMALVLNIPGFCIYKKSECSRVPNMPGFWIYQRSEYVSALNIPGFWIWLVFEYTKVLNMLRFCTCQDSEYTRVLNIPGLHRFLNVPEYPWIIHEYAPSCLWISQNVEH